MTELISRLKNENNIVGLSGGKDSVATCLKLIELGVPFETVTAEVWWQGDITGENPKHYEWMHGKLIPYLNANGVKTHFIRGIDAKAYMLTPIAFSKHHPERIGKYRGFPLCGRCGIQRDCKTRPCEKFYKQKSGYNKITGICANEAKRAESQIRNGNIPLFYALGIHECETYHICTTHGMLSPTYHFSNRGGCWFCPNQRIYELEILYREYPQLWSELMEIQNTPNKISELFNREQTLWDIEREIKRGVQMRFFYGGMI